MYFRPLAIRVLGLALLELSTMLDEISNIFSHEEAISGEIIRKSLTSIIGKVTSSFCVNLEVFLELLDEKLFLVRVQYLLVCGRVVYNPWCFGVCLQMFNSF